MQVPTGTRTPEEPRRFSGTQRNLKTIEWNLQTGAECLDVSLFARPAIEEGLRTDVGREREQLAELRRREIGLSHFLSAKIVANAFDVNTKRLDLRDSQDVQIFRVGRVERN